MKPELLQTICNFLVFLGAVIAAIGGYGSQYFGKQISNVEKTKNQGEQVELKKNIKELLAGNETLKDRLTPFEKLASEIHPTLKIDAALSQLKEDFKRLEEIASKHEYVSLENEKRKNIVNELKPIAELYNRDRYQIQITHETWTNAATQKYAVQLSKILSDAGFNVEGPTQITYYLVQQSSPVEWGYSPGMLNRMGELFEALSPIFTTNGKWTKREFDKTKNRIRIHFGGSVIFKKDGTVTVE